MLSSLTFSCKASLPVLMTLNCPQCLLNTEKSSLLMFKPRRTVASFALKNLLLLLMLLSLWTRKDSLMALSSLWVNTSPSVTTNCLRTANNLLLFNRTWLRLSIRTSLWRTFPLPSLRNNSKSCLKTSVKILSNSSFLAPISLELLLKLETQFKRSLLTLKLRSLLRDNKPLLLLISTLLWCLPTTNLTYSVTSF